MNENINTNSYIDKFSLSPVSSLFFAIAFLAIGYGMILTFVGVYLKELGLNDAVIGLINASFFLGAIGSSIFSQKIISSVGHIRSFATFASLMVISFLIQSLFFNEYLWAFLRFVSGFAFYALLIIIESWLNEKSSHTHRGKILAIYTIIFYLATALGQVFLNIKGDTTYIIFILGSVLILFSVLFISMTKIKEPILKPFEKYSFPKLYSVVPLALTGSFIGGFFVGGFFTMVPIYLMQKYSSIEVVSLFMACSIIGGLISQWPIGLLSDKYGRRKIIAYSGFYIFFISLLFLSSHLLDNYIYFLGIFLGFSIFSIYPLSLARANDVVDENKDIVEISRTLLFAYGLGSFIAPIILGIGLFYYLEFIFLIFAILGLFLGFYSLSKKRVADDDMSIFVNIPVASGSVVVELDPRQDLENENEKEKDGK
ncbi:MFS transporter [Arcobacter aquimarinus]|uniref:Major facilitator superfamily transporter n=1 Tax=Arcobacter aquimarinus TaxID=1315211 RepID=A0AAE7B600_9BACT|nr:MFS transporter [Arcobacter aquimarinus]QKE26419.1 major facilitator superfamily transporter [Arcobacter aquimarinus]RXI34509.1 MFS transporter [Arcobacter aquimarinus]